MSDVVQQGAAMAILHISESECYSIVDYEGIHLYGHWLTEAGFHVGMPVKVRIMPDCLVITAQNLRELLGCVAAMSSDEVSEQNAMEYLSTLLAK